MKYILIAFTAAFLFISCGDKNDTAPQEEEKNKFAYDTTDLKTTTIEDTDQSIMLQYKFEKGKKYSYRITTISEDHQTIKTDTSIDQIIKQNVIYLIDLEPAEIDNDGIMEVKFTISSIKMDASSNDQKISYESGTKVDSAERIKYAEYESMVSSPFSIRLAKNGEILEVFRVDKMVNEYLEIKGYLDSVSTQEKTMIRADLIDGVLKPLAVQVFRQMPSKDVTPDSTWSIPQNPSRFMVFQITNTNLYHIASFEKLEEDTLVKLEAELDTKITGERKVTERGVTYQFDKPVTSAEGTIYFNLTDGLVQKSKTGTTIEVFYTMEAQTPQGNQKGSRREKIRNTNIVERL